MLRIALTASLIALAGTGAAHAQVACDSLKGLQLPDVRIDKAVAGMSAANQSPSGAKRVPVCTVTGVIGREIKFEVVLPEAWNGKFAMGGQGGIAGSVGSQAGSEYGALQQGYAIAGTDTGHSGGSGAWAMDPFLGPERLVNYLHAAIHRVTVTSKAVVFARYSSARSTSCAIS